MCPSRLNLLVYFAEYDQMLASTVAHTVVHPVNPRDVVVAIIGGTMLTIALTRPRLRWVEQLTEGSESDRLWAERALTIFAFAMGGYAWASLYMTLHRQLGHEVDTVLKGAAGFIVIYAWLVHFEPFVAQWRLGGWQGSVYLYTGVATFAASIGVVIADVLLSSAFTLGDLQLLSVTGALAAAGWLIYKLIPRAEALLNRLLAAARKRSTQPQPPRQ